MLLPSSSAKFLRFGIFELDCQARELRRRGAKVKLQDQSLLVLETLLENAGNVVQREVLQKRIWPENTFVEFDQGLYSALARLRDALGDAANNPRFIETIPRRGYRFLAPVDVSRRPSTPSLPPAADAARVASISFQPSKKRFLAWTVTGLAVAAALATVFFLGWGYSSSRTAASAPPIGSLAVLPLQNVSADPQQEYFAEGMTDELITALAQASNLRVISRTSAMRYSQTQETLPQIARELNVDGVIEGTVAREGNRVRIRVQLIRAADDRHLWADEYDTDLRDVLLLQRNVARDIAGQIRQRLGASVASVPAQPARSITPAAYEAYLKGRYFLTRRSRESNAKAISYFQQAIREDPDSALAYSGLADAFMDQPLLSIPSPGAPERARAAALQAVRLDPSLAEVHLSLGNIVELHDWNWEEAEKEYRRAIAINPNFVTAHQYLAVFLAGMGRFDEAATEARIAEQLDPLSPFAYSTGAATAIFSHRRDEAAAQLNKALEIDPHSVVAHGNRMTLFMWERDYDRAVDEFRQWAPYRGIPQDAVDHLCHTYKTAGIRAFLRQRLPYASTSLDRAVLYVALDDKPNALILLEEARAERSPLMEFINVSPEWDSLRDEPRFRDLVRNLHIPHASQFVPKH